MERIVAELTIELWRIPIVVLSAVGIYLGFMVLVKVFGSRVLTSMTASDAVVVIMFGAVGGRVVLGHPPTLGAGLVGLLTLMLLEAAFGTIRRYTGWGKTINRRAILVVAHGKLQHDLMRHCHVSRTDVYTSVRRAGLGSVEQVAAMVLEPTGTLSIIRVGQPVQPETLNRVHGAERFFEPPQERSD